MQVSTKNDFFFPRKNLEIILVLLSCSKSNSTFMESHFSEFTRRLELFFTSEPTLNWQIVRVTEGKVGAGLKKINYCLLLQNKKEKERNNVFTR